jgi:hypothetical protein
MNFNKRQIFWIFRFFILRPPSCTDLPVHICTVRAHLQTRNCGLNEQKHSENKGNNITDFCTLSSQRQLGETEQGQVAHLILKRRVKRAKSKNRGQMSDCPYGLCYLTHQQQLASLLACSCWVEPHAPGPPHSGCDWFGVNKG